MARSCPQGELQGRLASPVPAGWRCFSSCCSTCITPGFWSQLVALSAASAARQILHHGGLGVMRCPVGHRLPSPAPLRPAYLPVLITHRNPCAPFWPVYRTPPFAALLLASWECHSPRMPRAARSAANSVHPCRVRAGHLLGRLF